MADMENGRAAEWLDYLISVIAISDLPTRGRACLPNPLGGSRLDKSQ